MKTNMQGDRGPNGACGICPKCGGVNVLWCNKRYENLCCDCGWTDSKSPLAAFETWNVLPDSKLRGKGLQL